MDAREITEKADAIIKERIQYEILRFTCQLFQKGGEYGYAPHSTGVCVCISDNHFILTASHVADDLDEHQTLYVKGNGKFIPIIGEMRQTDLSKDKEVDMSYIRLDNEIIEDFKFNHSFLSLKKIRGRHVVKEAASYIVFGFPTRNIKLEANTVITGASFFIMKPSKDKVYSFHKINPHKSILLDYSGKGLDMFTGESSGKRYDPYGISGCGLWYLDIAYDENSVYVDFFLVGLLLGGMKNKYQVLWANRIDILLAAMANFGDITIKPKKG